MVAHLTFIFPKEALAAVACHYAAFLSCLLDELHKTAEAFVADLQFRILGCTSYREHCKETPGLQSERYELFLEPWK